ncbi:hypothetical protein BBJ28_00006426 [Nothophytophthora sp. Chile5]|nr:hypothetical protein BBJ28_00006426 [Nothophytophthora sp. Chile5]
MSFLLAGQYESSSSGSESESEVEADAAGLELEQTTGDEHSRDAEVPTQLLPSADSVLSSVSATTASFLPPKHGATAKAAQSAVQTFDLLQEEETRRLKQKQEERERSEVERGAAAIARESRRKRPPPVERPTELPAKREKKEAKDRVKGQRLKGQAGIGTEFRSWKSETEMAMRQQFD